MKRFLIKLIPFFLWIFLLMVVVPVTIDPYNVFHVENIRDNGVEPNKNFLKTEYVIRHPEKFDAFLFGSSRVSSIHTDKIEGYRCYNMTYSEGVPKEHLDDLRAMLEGGVRPRMVMVGVDCISYMIDPEEHKNSPLRCPYPMNRRERAEFYLEYLEPITAVKSLWTTYFEPRAVSYDRTIYETGWTLDYGVESHMDWSEAKADWTVLYADRTPQALEEIRQLKELCDDNGIRLIVFTNPMHQLTYQKAMENGYREFLAGLAQVTDYYNFSGINGVTTDNGYYLETSHYKPEVGDMILEAIFEGKVDEELEEQGFGYYVTKENCEDFLRMYVDGE